jgi:hypothetical protein
MFFPTETEQLNIDCGTFCIVNRQFLHPRAAEMREKSQEKETQKQALRVSVPTIVKSHKFNAMGSLPPPPLTKT